MDAGGTLAGFLEQLAAGTPTPGSGAAAAVTGAAAAALLAMVCRVTARRASSSTLTEAAARADTLRHRLLGLASEDAAAYAAVIAARRGSEAGRAEAVEAAMRHATGVPLDLARASGEVLALAALLADEVSDAVLGELAVALELARAACAGAAVTVRLNVHDVRDTAFVTEAREALDAVVVAARTDGDRLATRLAARTGLPGRGPASG